MTQEQYKKAVELNERINQLEEVQKELFNDSGLCYAYKRTVCGIADWEIFPRWYIRFIKNILDKHDKMIRQEINDEIKKLKSKIEEI